MTFCWIFYTHATCALEKGEMTPWLGDGQILTKDKKIELNLTFPLDNSFRKKEAHRDQGSRWASSNYLKLCFTKP